MLLILFTRK